MTHNWSRTLRWPLWSWRNLTITCVAGLTLLSGLGHLTQSGTPTAVSTAHPATARAEPVVVSTAQSQLVPGTPSPAVGTPTLPPDSLASATASGTGTSPVNAATGFVTAWAHKTTTTAWHQGLTPWATPKLLAALAATSPDQVPATQVTGDAALIVRTVSTAQVSVPTDGGRVAVALIVQAGSWKADGIAPDEQPPGATTPPLGPTPAGAG
jgi:hypothetical protein